MPKIIIIDDDSVCNMLSKRNVLKYVNADIQCFLNPKEALNAIVSETKLPDYILLDLIMPEMDGWSFLDKLKSEIGNKKITSKIIILTSSIRASDRVKAQSFDCIVDYINKPIEKKDLIKIINPTLIKNN